MKLLSIILSLLLFISCQEEKYPKEELPQDFTISITSNSTYPAHEKNEVYVNISQDLTIGQIATLANMIYDELPKQRRSYIFYKRDQYNGTWATSHYDPELEIIILGVSDKQIGSVESKTEGKIIGKWRTDKYRFAVLLSEKTDGQYIATTMYNFGEPIVREVECQNISNGTKLFFPNDHGEYYVVYKNGNLGLYSNNGKYDEAIKIE